MNAHVKPKIDTTTHNPVEALDVGLDIIRTVRLALMSEWIAPSELLPIAAALSRGIEALEPLRQALDNGSESTFDSGVPEDKILIDRRIPRAAI